MGNVRGRLYDIKAGYPGVRDRVEPAEHLLTCGIAFLYIAVKELREIEDRRKAEAELTPARCVEEIP
jgi:hypothetical protein